MTTSATTPMRYWRAGRLDVAIGSERGDRVQYGRRVVVHLHVVPALRHPSVRTDEEGRPRDTHERPPVQALLLPDAVLLGHRVVLVGEEGEVERMLRGELGLAGSIQHAHPEHRRLALLELRQRVPERAR